MFPVRVAAREIEKINAAENDEEAAEEGDSVDGVGSVEALEEDEGGTEGGGCKGYVIERCYSISFQRLVHVTPAG